MNYALIGCSASKLSGSHHAKDLYIGALFKAAKAYCEHNQLQYLILSANYGLIWPTELIRDYDLPINHLSKSERAAWGIRVLRRLDSLSMTSRSKSCLFLAGSAYYEPLAGRLPNVQLPLKGLGIGQQKAWLRNAMAVAS